VEKDVGIMVEEQLDRSQKCALQALKANESLDYIKRSVGSRSREVILPLHSVLVRTHLEYRAQFRGPP